MSIQNEFSSFKLLLKQIYNAHTTKVKELESEVKILKEKLTEKERETNNNLLDCKRCNELEEAFKSCKKALHDQSKLFESFGQKFSIFSSPELGSQEINSASKAALNCSSRFSRSLKNNAALWDKNESSIISFREDTITENKVNSTNKVPVTSNNQNLLKNVICDIGNLESLDAYTVTFPENVNVKCDSLILAPDSLDVSLDSKRCVLPKDDFSKLQKNKKVSNCNENENLRQVEKKPESKVSCKRASDSVNEERVKRCNTGTEVGSCSKATTTKDVKACGPQVSKTVASNGVSKQIEAKSKISLKDANPDNVKVSKKKVISSEVTESKDRKKIEAIESKDKKKIISNEVIESKDIKIETPKSSVNNMSYDFKNKFTSHEISPSLLPTNVNILQKVINLDSTSNDKDDFQELAPTNKPAQSEDSWDSCDKKKFLKKNKGIKPIKTTSKFKMTLDAPPLNYKKPNLKQTKLSKSLFKGKEVNLEEKSLSSKQNEDIDLELIEDDSSPTALQDQFQTSTQCGVTKSPFTVDIDATFIPENFKFEISPCVTSSVKKNAVEKSNFKNGGLFSNISFPEELKLPTKDSHGNENDTNDHSSCEDAELKENMNSFDRLPIPEEPNYKYKNDVVRKKSERRRLNAFDCKECEKYYSELGLSDKEKKERMKKCSRHRGKFTPPQTPDHFWELDFPDTEECKARGYMNETQKVKLNNICNI